jgi:hypothetical protein
MIKNKENPMFFYIIQLFDIEYKDDMILALTSAGIMRGTYMEGENLDHLLNQDFPIFKGFFKMKEDKERISSLFFGFTEKRETLTDMVKVLKDAGIDNEKKEIFHIMALSGEEII